MDNELDNELMHYGVLGMRWGVRRTPEQLGHKQSQSKESSSSNNGIGQKAGSQIRKFSDRFRNNVVQTNGKFTVKDGKLKGTGQKEEWQEQQSKEARKKEVLDSRSAKELYKNADLFTTKELNDAYNRLVLERNIASLTPKETSKGEQYVDSAIKWTKKATDFADSGIKAYNTVAKITNTFGGTKLPMIKEPDKDKKIFDYNKLRSKRLGDLTDDELKALNSRERQEEQYTNRHNPSTKDTKKEYAKETSASEPSSSSPKPKKVITGYRTTMKNTPVNDPKVTKYEDTGRKYIEGARIFGYLPEPKKEN